MGANLASTEVSLSDYPLTRRSFVATAAASAISAIAAPHLVAAKSQTVPLVRIHLSHEPFPFDPAKPFRLRHEYIYRSVYAPMTRLHGSGWTPYLVESIEEDYDHSGQKPAWRILVKLSETSTWFGPNTRSIHPLDITRTIQRLRAEGKKPWDEVMDTSIIDSRSFYIFLRRRNVSLWREAFPRAIGCMTFDGATIDIEAMRNGEASGPYFVEDHRDQQSFDLVRRDDWQSDPVTIDRARFFIIRNTETALAEFRAERLDIIDITSLKLGSRPQPGINEFRESFITVPSDRVFYVGMDQRQAPLADQSVRQAVMTVLDQNQIAQVGFRDNARVAFGIVPSHFTGAMAERDRDFAQGNTDRAREILAQSSFPNGFEISLSVPGWLGEPVQRMAMVIRAQLQQIGIDAVLQTVPVQPWFNEFPGRLGIFIQRTFSAYDPSETLRAFVSNDQFNTTGVQIAEFDEIFQQALDSDERGQVYLRMQALLLDNAVVVPIAHVYRTWALSDVMRNSNLEPAFAPNGELGDLIAFQFKG